MSVALVQIGDIHITNRDDGIFDKADKLAACVKAETQSSVRHCFLLVTGDTVQAGQPCEFEVASVVSHPDGVLSSAALARATFARMSSAFFVHWNALGLSL